MQEDWQSLLKQAITSLAKLLTLRGIKAQRPPEPAIGGVF